MFPCADLTSFPQHLSWLPANDVAATLHDLLVNDAAANPIYHVENPVRQPWSEMIGTLAHAIGVSRENIVPFAQWLDRVRKHTSSPDSENPAKKIMEFWEKEFVRMACGGLVLDTRKSEAQSKTLAGAGPVDAALVQKYIRAWQIEGFLRS